MKYVEAELVQTDTIEQLYGKLVVLMNHLADELKPIVERQGRYFSVRTPTPGVGNASVNGSGAGGEEGGGSNDYATDPMLMMEIAMCGDMSYYVELLEQAAELFSVRRSNFLGGAVCPNLLTLSLVTSFRTASCSNDTDIPRAGAFYRST
ncbi:unnamed protein product [Phytophthora fragariaefolia]|uniref:Unnamed protein product n=1 Tax=Phytophthora fragariaefolia TaxID=1490495 RepID=A0A9W6U1T2_9STRA|nr:unnamed protein product [Phytophthora fragariaefolia]